jgi:hypothetical protein
LIAEIGPSPHTHTRFRYSFELPVTSASTIAQPLRREPYTGVIGSMFEIALTSAPRVC